MTLNKKQRSIVILSVCAVVFALLFPPWLFTFDHNGSNGGHRSKPAGYCCIFWPPAPEDAGLPFGVRVDVARLLIECGCIAVASAVALLFAVVMPPSVNAPLTPPQQSVPHERAPRHQTHYSPVSLKQLFYIAILGVIAVVSAATIVVKLNKSPKEALLSSPLPTSTPPFEAFLFHNPRPSASEFLEDVVPDRTSDELLRINADNGVAAYQGALGLRYFNGKGVIKDYVEAGKWFLKAADQGNALAQADLGFCYASGLGVPKDYVQGYMWYNLAEAQGQPESSSNLALLEKEMTREQIASAQQLSRAFKARASHVAVLGDSPGFIEVEVQGLGKVQFPDIMTQDEIRAVLRRKFPPSVLPETNEWGDKRVDDPTASTKKNQ